MMTELLWLCVVAITASGIGFFNGLRRGKNTERLRLRKADIILYEDDYIVDGETVYKLLGRDAAITILDYALDGLEGEQDG